MYWTELLLNGLELYFNVSFNTVPRQHHKVWDLHFPYLHSFMDNVPPSEACLYDHINWSLAKIWQ